jgi:hypothetical protein
LLDSACDVPRLHQRSDCGREERDPDQRFEPVTRGDADEAARLLHRQFPRFRIAELGRLTDFATLRLTRSIRSAW